MSEVPKVEGQVTPLGLDILVLTYNRPDSLRQLLTRLQASKPRSISVWIDGPRSKSHDGPSVLRCRQVAEEMLAGPKDSIRHNHENLGVRRSVTQGVDWFFSDHDEGLILEDDLLPEHEALHFAHSALRPKYELAQLGVGFITGSNLVPSDSQGDPTALRLSDFFSSWGWASWSDQWERLRKELAAWSCYRDALSEHDQLPRGANRPLKRIYDRISGGRMDSWAYVALLESFRLGLRTLTPPVNTVANRGFGADATHTRHAPKWAIAATVTSPLPHACTTQTGIVQADWDPRADAYLARNVYGLVSPWGPKRFAEIARRATASVSEFTPRSTAIFDRRRPK